MKTTVSDSRKYFSNGAVFDFLMMGLFFFVGPLIRNFLEKEVWHPDKDMQHLSWKVGVLYISTSFAQAIGFWLKRKRVAYIIDNSRGGSTGTGFFIGAVFITIMHFSIFGFLMMNDGFNYLFKHIPWWLTIIKIIAIFIPTTVAIIVSVDVYKSKVPVKLTVVDEIRDIVGTLLLAFSCLVVTSLFWDLISGLGAELHSTSIISNIFISLLFAATFLLFYLPPRWCFLLTDYQYRMTWIRIWIVFLPFLKDLWWL